MPGTRSKSVPRERSPRVVHKDSLQRVQQHQMQKLTLSSVRPASSCSSSSSSGSRPASAQLQESARSSRPSSARSSGSGCDSPHCNGTSALGFSGAEQCKCNICTCGKHHCPKVHTSGDIPLDATTSYSNTFKEHHPASFPTRVKPIPSYNGPTSSVPGQFDTTHSSHFAAPEIKHHHKNIEERMERSTRPMRPKTPEKFEHTSVQRADYPWHSSSSSPSAAPRPSTATPYSSGPFYGTTTTQAHYVEWEPSTDAFKRAPMSQSNPFPDAPMDLATSYKSQYAHHSVERATSMKPKSSTYSYGGPRDFQTSNMTSFTGKQNARCPAANLAPRPASARSGHMKYRIDSTGEWA